MGRAKTKPCTMSSQLVRRRNSTCRGRSTPSQTVWILSLRASSSTLGPRSPPVVLPPSEKKVRSSLMTSMFRSWAYLATSSRCRNRPASSGSPAGGTPQHHPQRLRVLEGHGLGEFELQSSGGTSYLARISSYGARISRLRRWTREVHRDGHGLFPSSSHLRSSLQTCSKT